jgi:hypothetical protein
MCVLAVGLGLPAGPLSTGGLNLRITTIIF